MSGYRKFLSYYSVLMTTLLFVGSLFFIPRPENFLFLVLFAPACLYFWLNIKKRSKAKPTDEATASDQSASLNSKEKPRWIALVMLTIVFTLFISNLSIYLYSKLGKAYFPMASNLLESQTETSKDLENLKEEIGKLPASKESDKQILDTLAEIKNELSYLKTSQATKSSVLGSSAIPAVKTADQTNNLVTINDTKWGAVDVFNDKSFSSKTIGKLAFGKNYPYSQKEGTWYFVSLPENQEGWVNSRFVKEVSAP